MAALDACSAIEHVVIHTGQNYDYELFLKFFDEMELRWPDHYCGAASEYSSAISTVAGIMEKLEVAFLKYTPDAILILGDTNSCVAAAYTAKRMHIPIFHMEAGNRCFDERVPEESNRRVVDTLSDINMPYSDLALMNLTREGYRSDRVIKTGSPQNEILEYYEKQIEASQVLSQLNLTPREYFLVSVHREENCIPAKFQAFVHMLDELADMYHQRVIVSLHPRLRTRFIGGVGKFELHKPFGFFDYNKLQRNARVVLSDSGTITEESVLSGFRALNLRETHERPEGAEQAAVMMTSFENAPSLVPVVESHEQALVPDDYCHSNVSEKIVRTILGYVDYVNRNVWRK
jgi:UDP-N-acetylglucosamine 2-epimerase (non-hydrolysing)